MTPAPDAKNKLYYGDNLQVLREYIADASVDLVYLDPPFNSRQDYNVLFAEKDGNRSSAQVTAFKDTWEWNLESQAAYEEIVERGGRVADAMRAFKTLLGNTDMMAYLAMMAPRLVELHRVLKPTGSIYLHCDPTASHYLKLLMDAVFGPLNFRSEIIWKRTSAHNSADRFGPVHDTIVFYSKSNDFTWTGLTVPHDPDYVEEFFRSVEPQTGRKYHANVLTGAGTRNGESGQPWRGVNPTEKGRHWALPAQFLQQIGVTSGSVQERLDALDKAGRIYWPAKKDGSPRLKYYEDELTGAALPDVWTDIPPISGKTQERLGYPTQKPEALLERILKASSNEDELVLDPFCGCGTTVQVAQKLHRRWIGIDVTHLAISLIKKRLSDTFGEEVKTTFQVIGEPIDMSGAEQLALENKYQFQYWALSKVEAQPLGGIKKGADRGVDGRKYFFDDRSGHPKQIIFSVKGGHNIGVSEVRDLVGVLQREKAEIGVYISFEEPTKPMIREAADAGFYNSPAGGQYPRLQLLTIKNLLLDNKRVEFPRLLDATFKKAPRHRDEAPKNMTLDLIPGDDDGE